MIVDSFRTTKSVCCLLNTRSLHIAIIIIIIRMLCLAVKGVPIHIAVIKLLHIEIGLFSYLYAFASSLTQSNCAFQFYCLGYRCGILPASFGTRPRVAVCYSKHLDTNLIILFMHVWPSPSFY